MADPQPTSRTAWVALCLVPRLGGRTLARLLARFGSVEAVLAAPEADLRRVPKVGAALAAAIRAADPAHTEAAIRAWRQAGIALLTPADADYPPALRGLDDAPPLLFARGALQPGDARAVVVVGTRRPSPAARDLAEAGAAALAARGWTIVSGLAEGIDAAAHRGALRAGGRTLAVLGSGVRCVYPPQHAALAEEIAAHGALLAEVPPGAAPERPALVARNRIISGLSRAVIVVEAGPSSGSLHAARFARAQGRTVLTIPASVEGNRRLLSEGAGALPADPTAWHAALELRGLWG